MLIGYLAVSSFNGNYYRAYEFSQMMKLVKKIDYSRFIRRIRDLEKAMENIKMDLNDKKIEHILYMRDLDENENCLSINHDNSKAKYWDEIYNGN